MAIKQRCPNCQEPHDVSVHVTGQRIPCRRCGLKFDVVRRDVQSAPGLERARTSQGSSGRGLEAEASLRAEPLAGGPSPEASPTHAARPVSLALEATVASGGSVPAPGAPKPPRIPGFELLAIVGRGGMGEVWRAKQLSLGREVAIKTLAAHLAEEPDFVRRFEKEATALAALAHPHVVGIFDRGSAGGLYYLVMEFISGPSLRDRMGAGTLPLAATFEIAQQLLSALDYAHQRGIVHRDLKPENILFTPAGQTKVADFGLAAILGRESSLHVTRPAVAMGTLSYMAPEQRRDAHAVDGRADLYSLAVIVYEMLTGELPLGRFQLPSRRVAGLDERLDAVLEKALDPEPSSRFQTAGELGSALLAAASVNAETAPAGLKGWLRKLKG